MGVVRLRFYAISRSFLVVFLRSFLEISMVLSENRWLSFKVAIVEVWICDVRVIVSRQFSTFLRDFSIVSRRFSMLFLGNFDGFQ